MSTFADIFHENGILPPANSRPPTNLCEIYKRVTASYGTTGTECARISEYARYVRSDKVTMMLEKDYDVYECYRLLPNKPFTGFPKDVGLNNGLTPPQPSIIEGLGKAAFEPFPIEHVSGAVLYEDDPFSIALPHLAGECVDPMKSMERATLQCAYDGAALVYARNKALQFIGKPDPLGHAEITTYASVGDTIEFFAHYAAPGDDGKLEYHQYPIGSGILTGFHYPFGDGWRQLENLKIYAREQSSILRDQLVDYWEAKEGIALSTPRSCRHGVLNGTLLEPGPN